MQSVYRTGRDIVVGGGKKVISGLDVFRGAGAAAPTPTTALAKPESTGGAWEYLKKRPVEMGGAVVGAVAGGVLWKEHRVLGTICGLTVGRAVPMLVRGDAEDKHEATYEIAATGLGTLLSLNWPSNQAVGFALGAIVGDLAARWIYPQKKENV